MNIACGTDIIEISRIKETISNELGNSFIERIFTKKEIDYCESKNNNKYQHYAARFAAKEAIFKAISKKMSNKYEIEWKQIEILNDDLGRPFVIVDNDINIKIESIDISLSHCKEYAVANAVVVFKGE